MVKKKEEPQVAPTNYDKVETDGQTVTSKSESKNKKRGSSYQGNPTDPYENKVQKNIEEKTKPTKKKGSPSKKGKKSRPEPTTELEEQSTREDG